MMRTEPTKEEQQKRQVTGRRYAQVRRDTLGMSQLQLSRTLGVDIKTIKRRENGKRRVKPLNWWALCGIHQLSAFKSLDGMLGGDVLSSLDGEGIWSTKKEGDKAQGIRALPRSISETLMKMRSTCDMTPVQWAGSMGVNVGTVLNAESGKHGVTREVFFASVSLFIEVKFQTVDLQRRTHRYPKHLQSSEKDL